MEPWLYGTSTGLSPVAIIAAAVFWTWLWGPVGLLLSTPLTVCLVVLGRHVPRFAFLDVLLGNEPVLSPPELLYWRLLVGDPHEATERAEEYLRAHSLARYYDDVALPALMLAENDRAAGRLADDHAERLLESMEILLENLAEWEEPSPPETGDDEVRTTAALKPDRGGGGGGLTISAGARGALDDAAAAMLAELVERRGGDVRLLPWQALRAANLKDADLHGAEVVVLSYMNADSLAHARFLVRRLRRKLPDAAIVVGFWTFAPEDRERRDPLKATGADAVVTSLEEAMAIVFATLSERRAARDAGDLFLQGAA